MVQAYNQRQGPNTGQPQNEFILWLNSVPAVTRFIIVGTVAVSVAARLGLVSYGWLFYDFYRSVAKFEVRIVCWLYGTVS